MIFSKGIKKSFTLMEILIVVSVLAILVGIIVPRIKGFQEQAKLTKAQAGLKALEAAVESYHTNNQNMYPSALTDILSATPQMVDAAALADPLASPAANYKYSTSGGYYSLSSVGLDGTNGTGGVVSSGDVPTSGDDLLNTNGGSSPLDTQVDENNCGTIGTLCVSGQSCTNGVCACASGVLNDVDNCGVCDNACASGELCTIGVCVDPCVATPVAGTVCADTTVYVSATLRTTPSNLSDGTHWHFGYAVTGATSTTDGEANTTMLVGQSNVANACASLIFGDYDDWYVPAKDQLNLMRSNSAAIGGFGWSWFWSSTEFNSNDAWCQDFGNGAQYHNPKDYARALRCVRTP